MLACRCCCFNKSRTFKDSWMRDEEEEPVRFHGWNQNTRCLRFFMIPEWDLEL